VIVSLLDSTFDLGPGRLLPIEPEVMHSVVAIEDSALMLTIAHGRADSTAPAR
jgi:quercetin dioxygenase-like cupin family protein